MWFSLLFLPFWALAQLDPDHILSHIQENVDPSVLPCDDFYRHVCPAKLDKTDQIKETLKKWFSDAVEPYEISSNYLNFIITFMTDKLSTRKDVSMEELTLNFFHRCVTNESLFRDTYLLRPRGDDEARFSYCLNTTEEQLSFLTSDSTIELLAEYVDEAQKTLPFFSKWFGYVNDEKNEFGKKDRRAIQLFEESKTVMLNLLLKSGWVRKHNLAIRIANILHTLSFHSWSNGSSFENFERSYKECIQGTSGLLAVEYDHCLIRAKSRDLPGISSEWGAEYQDQRHRVVVYPPMYGSFEFQDEISVLSTFAYAVAHEIGHAIFRNIEDSESPVDLQCLANHIHNTCETFKGGWICESGWKTLKEDTADIAARTVTLHMARQLAKSYNSTSHNLCWEQLYFYGLAVNWCTEQNDSVQYDFHSSAVVRVNGVLSQSTDFQTAFGCKAGDRMVTPEEDRCFIYGTRAMRSK